MSRARQSRRKPATGRPPEVVGRNAGERVLSLDLSSKCVGYALFDGGALTTYGKMAPSGDGYGEKLGHFREWLAELLTEARPDVVILEKPYPGHNKNAYRVLTMFFGVVFDCHFQHFLAELPDEHQLATVTVKSVLKLPKGQNHDDNKRIAVDAVNQRCGLSLTYVRNDRDKRRSDDDIADAIALNLAFHLKYRTAPARDPATTTSAGIALS